MKTLKVLLCLFIAVFLVSTAPAQNKKAPNGYVGAETCGMCHKTEKQGMQLSIWQNSPHAQAFKVLQTDKANAIAKELGHPTPAAETEECLKCHASGYNYDKTLLGAKFSMADGVQCETCHGPGSNYKDAKTMKDMDKAIENGLVYYETPTAICGLCHNKNSPTYKEMDFAAAWEKIKHPVPGKTTGTK